MLQGLNLFQGKETLGKWCRRRKVRHEHRDRVCRVENGPVRVSTFRRSEVYRITLFCSRDIEPFLLFLPLRPYRHSSIEAYQLQNWRVYGVQALGRPSPSLRRPISSGFNQGNRPPYTLRRLEHFSAIPANPKSHDHWPPL